MDPVPEGNTRKPEVKDYVDVKKQAAKLGHPARDALVCLHHLLNRYLISPEMVIISIQCSICKEGYGNDTISQAKHTWEDFAERVTDIIFLYVVLVSYPFDKKSSFTRLGKWQMEGFDDLDRVEVLTLQQEIQLKRKSHLLNGSNFVVIGQPKSSTLKTYAQIA